VAVLPSDWSSVGAPVVDGTFCTLTRRGWRVSVQAGPRFSVGFGAPRHPSFDKWVSGRLEAAFDATGHERGEDQSSVTWFLKAKDSSSRNGAGSEAPER